MDGFTDQAAAVAVAPDAVTVIGRAGFTSGSSSPTPPHRGGSKPARGGSDRLDPLFDT